MYIKTISILALTLAVSLSSCKKEEDLIEETPIESSDPTLTISGFISTNTTWSSDKVYLLDGKVVVNAGATLTIEPGTIIKGKEGTGTLASSLIIAKGGKINATGTASQPIIFTSILDNIKIGELTGTNLDENDKGKWGGLVVLGNAPVSDKGGDTQGHAEGIPATDAFGAYGGNNMTDTSGILKYISIRHGGTTIAPGKEINGLTLAGVGSGTVIDYVEIVANEDDGIEFFGGTVNASNLIASFQGDDGIDIDQNYSGTISNALILQGSGSDEAFEIDGPEGSTHTSGLFTVQNVTAKSFNGDGEAGDLKSLAQGTLSNILWEGYTDWLKVRENFDAANSCSAKNDAYDNFIGGTLIVSNSVFLNATDLDAAITVYTDETTCNASLTPAIDDAMTTILTNNGNSTSGSTGADLTKFNSWSWNSIKGNF